MPTLALAPAMKYCIPPSVSAIRTWAGLESVENPCNGNLKSVKRRQLRTQETPKNSGRLSDLKTLCFKLF